MSGMSVVFQAPKPAVRRSLALSEQRLRLQSLTQYSLSSKEDHVEKLDENHLSAFVDDLSGVEKTEQTTRKKRKQNKTGPPIHVGDAVEADYQMMGDYYPAAVIGVDGDSITVKYEEDGIVETLPDEYVELLAKATDTAPPRPKSGTAAASAANSTSTKPEVVYQTTSPDNDAAIDPTWLAMLDKLCEYQEAHGYQVSPEDEDLYRWWVKTKKEYVTKRKRHACSFTREHVELLEERAGWSYSWGKIYFPEEDDGETKQATTEKNRKRKK